jgi:hypothetical protein
MESFGGSHNYALAPSIQSDVLEVETRGIALLCKGRCWHFLITIEIKPRALQVLQDWPQPHFSVSHPPFLPALFLALATLAILFLGCF